jgi:superfamily I DNA/RNA helicase
MQVVESIPVLRADKLIWGPPGTGKTHKGVELIQSYGFTPQDIAAITYRVPMAKDLKHALIESGFAESEEELPFVSTIHGVIRRVLDYPTESCIYGDPDKGSPNRLKEFFKELRIQYVENGEGDTQPETLGNLFLEIKTWCVNTLTSYDEWYKAPKAELFVKKSDSGFFGKLLEKYEFFKRENGFWDFDDLLRAAIHSNEYPPVKLLFLDEAQDLTPAMHFIVAKWSEEIPVIIVAGDPNQSIYGFLGANPELFWNHTKAKEFIQLEKTYRLPENTWNLARKILKISKHPVPRLTFRDKSGVLQSIHSSKLEGILKKTQTPAFHLVRANFQRERIAELLRATGRPFKGCSGEWTDNDFNLYNAIFEIRKHHREGFTSERLIPLPYLQRLGEVYRKELFNCKKKDISKLEVSWRDIHSVLSARLISLILSSDPFAIATTSKLSESQRLKVTNALVYNDRPLHETDCHRIMTIHAAKGLQAEIVFLYSEWTKKIAQESDFKEEARVWYVATTRHLSTLIIVNGLFSDIPACEPCPFLEVLK